MKKILLSFTVLMLAIAVNAQYYYIPDHGSNPGGLNTDDELPDGTGGTGWSTIKAGSATTPSWSPNQTLPFTFQFNGSAVTQYRVSTSGILNFDTATFAAPGYTRGALPNAAIPDKSVCIWGIAGLGSNDVIATKVFGVAPKRQLWIAFNSYSYASSTSDGSNFTYWAIALEEGSNNIYIVDQRTGGYSAANKKVSAGIQLNATTAYTVDGSPDLASLATGVAGSETPDDNYYYMFVQGTQPAYDMAALKVTVAKDLVLAQGPYTISLDVKNLGLNAVTGVTVNYSVNGGAAVSSPISSLSIAKFASSNVSSLSKWTPSGEGTFNLKVWVNNPNGNADGAPGNDTASLDVKVWENFSPRRALHEIFTSSTCPPCLPGNIVMHQVLNQKLGKYTVIKYQYFGPGNGDPYFTAESYNRGVYYGQTTAGQADYGIPDLHIDGGTGFNPQGYTTTLFDQSQTVPSFLEITPTFTQNGQSVSVSAVIKPLINYPTGTYKVRMAVVEKYSTKNVTTNGETEFYYVMKKMLPNETGTTLTMPAKNQSTTVEQSYTFPGKYRLPVSARTSSSVVPTGAGYNGINLATENTVEEFEDLAVVVFVQNDANKEILQSAWTAQDWASGIAEVNNDDHIQLYPNPAQSSFTVNVKNAKEVSVRVLDLNGKEILRKAASETNEAVDCSQLPTGLYFVELNIDGKNVIKKLNIVR